VREGVWDMGRYANTALEAPAANAELPLPDPASVFEPWVLTAVSRISAEPPPLRAGEWVHVATACPERKHEFASGRQLARSLLGRLGWHDTALLANGDGSPAWPHGVVGSIAHADDVCIVALAAAGHAVGLGVDLEPQRPVEPELRRLICTEGERAMLASWPADQRGIGGRLIFSAKESVYKCQYPVLRMPFGFQDLAIVLDISAGTFTTELPNTACPGAGGRIALCGRFHVGAGWIVTGATLHEYGN
jgi:4'-phosphopantetheinyl transferase EntD